MQLPNEPSAGSPIDADWGRAVVQNLRALSPRGGAGLVVSQNGQGTAFSALGGPVAGSFQEARQIPSRMFKVGCYRSSIVVRTGKIQMGTLAIAAEVLPADAGTISLTGKRFTINAAAGWTDDESRYPYVEIHPGTTPHAYVRLSASSALPGDDAGGIVFRWPLAEVTGRMVAVAPTEAVPEPDPAQIFITAVLEVLHDGIIKMPGELAPP